MPPYTQEELDWMEEQRERAAVFPDYLKNLPAWSSDQGGGPAGAPMSIDPGLFAPQAAAPSTSPLSFDIENRLKGLQGQYSTNIFEANQEPQLSGTQVGISAAVKLLPLLLGMAIAKRRSFGAAAGAQAGLGAAAEYEKGALATQEKKAKTAGLLAQQNLKEIGDVRNQMFQVRKQEDAQAQQSELFRLAEAGREQRFREGQKGADRRAVLGRVGEGDFDEITQRALIKKQKGEVLDAEEEKALAKNYKVASLSQRTQEELGIGERREEYQKIKDAEAYIEGFKWKAGKRPPASATSKARDLDMKYGIVGGALNELRTVFSDKAASIDEKANVLANAVMQVKNLNGMGANFTQLEKDLVDAGLPSIATLSFGEAFRWAKAEIQGQSAISKIDRLINRTQYYYGRSMGSYGYEPEAAQPTGASPQSVPAGAVDKKQATNGKWYYRDAQGNALAEVVE